MIEINHKIAKCSVKKNHLIASCVSNSWDIDILVISVINDRLQQYTNWIIIEL